MITNILFIFYVAYGSSKHPGYITGFRIRTEYSHRIEIGRVTSYLRLIVC